ncbi:MAG: hypothetical protein NC117_10960, partial [Pseudoflavonifractor sp.]|nr:hypothetical protein [Pseudoflavonifractor sp.]
AHASKMGIELGSRSIYMSPKSLHHATRDSKVQKGLALRVDDIASFPKLRRRMDLYFDGASYVYTDYRKKFIIHPNYSIKTNQGKKRKVAFITAGIVTNPKEFNLSKYEKV